MMRSLAGVLLLIVAASGLATVEADNPCPAQPVHTYGLLVSNGHERHVAVDGVVLSSSSVGADVGPQYVVVADSNLSECDGDPNTAPDFDGDYDTGLGGAFFGYGPWADEPICAYGLHEHGGSIAVNDVVFGSNVGFVTAQDDTSGPVIVWTATGIVCTTNGIIAPHVDFDDCISTSAVPCGPGGGDGGLWVVLSQMAQENGGVSASNPATAGTITFY